MKTLKYVVLFSIALQCALSPDSIARTSDGALPALSNAQLLEQIQRRGFDYFWNECGTNGLIQDRMSDRDLSLIMAVGFQLPVYCIGAEHGWVTREMAAERTLTVLKTFGRLPVFHGMFAHYYDIPTGAVVPLMHEKDDGADVSETGFMMAGVLTAMGYFDADNPVESEIRQRAKRLFDSVEWSWMLRDTEGRTHRTLSWHWSPNHGFGIGQRVKSNMELSSMITYLLAIGAESNAIPSECWNEGWTANYRWLESGGNTFIVCPPLFGHQYAQSWVDFRNRKDRHADYFRNSIYAISANRLFCITNLYPELNIWGLTFCDAPSGYGIYGYPPRAGKVDEEATIAPTGAGGSVAFLPDESISTLQTMYQVYGDRLWGKYGFFDAFSVKMDWFDDDYISIDQGTMVVMIENHLTGLPWKWFMRTPYIRNGLQRIGFVGVIDDFEPCGNASPYAEWSCDDGFVTAYRGLKREGAASLRLRSNAGQVTLAARPARVDFSEFSFLSVWVFGADAPQIELLDGEGRQYALFKDGVLHGSDGWLHAVYRLPTNDSFDLSLVTGVVVQVNSGGADPIDCLLDAAYLVYSPDMIPPARITDISAVSTPSPGEARVTWSRSGNDGLSGTCYRYLLRYARRPIRTEEDFDQATPALDLYDRRIGGTQTSYRVTGLRPGAKYYFAVKAEDEALNRSAVSPCASARSGQMLSSPVLDDFGDDSLLKGPSVWLADPRTFRMQTVSDRVGESVVRALQIDYDKRGPGEEWAHVRFVPRHRNFGPYKHLCMSVRGDATILLKLVHSEDSQSDIEIQSVEAEQGWTELRFDLSKSSGVDLERINECLLFLQPGESDCSGSLQIDSIWLEKATWTERIKLFFAGL